MKLAKDNVIMARSTDFDAVFQKVMVMLMMAFIIKLVSCQWRCRLFHVPNGLSQCFCQGL